MCKKFEFLTLECTKKGNLESGEGNGRPSKKDAWSVETNSITDSP
jgi:hypothetical protein